MIVGDFMIKKSKNKCRELKTRCKSAVGKITRHAKKDGFFMRVWKSIYK